MSTNRNKSFIAEITTADGHVHFPRYSMGKTVIVLDPDGGLFARNINISNYLCIDHKKSTPSLDFYFRCTNDYYHIYVRTAGAYAGMTLTRNEDGALVAEPAAGSKTTSFNLLDDSGKVITLDDIGVNSANLKIQTRGENILHTNRYCPQGYFIYGNGFGNQIKFKLNILKRNVPWDSDPDEI